MISDFPRDHGQIKAHDLGTSTGYPVAGGNPMGNPWNPWPAAARIAGIYHDHQ